MPVEADEGLMALILLKCMIEQGEKVQKILLSLYHYLPVIWKNLK